MKYNYKGEFKDTFNRKYEVFLEDTSQTPWLLVATATNNMSWERD